MEGAKSSSHYAAKNICACRANLPETYVVEETIAYAALRI